MTGAGFRKEISMKTFLAANQFVSFLRKREREIEKVVEVLRPGPLGVVELESSQGDLANARLVTARALEKWREELARHS